MNEASSDSPRIRDRERTDSLERSLVATSNFGGDDGSVHAQTDGQERVNVMPQGTDETDGRLRDAVYKIEEGLEEMKGFVKDNCKDATKLFLKRCLVRLWKLVYWFSRLCLTFWALETAVMICALSVNFVLQFILGMFLPVIQDQEINGSLVNAGSFFFLLAILYPILALIPVPFGLAFEIWSEDELPRTRLLFEYIRFSLDKAMKYENTKRDKLSLWIQCGKATLIIIFLILSLAISQSRALELFFLIGLYIGVIVFVLWLCLSTIVQFIAFRRNEVAFPTTALLVAIRFSSSGMSKDRSSFVQKAAESEKRLCHKVTLAVVFSIHVLVSLTVVGPAFAELGSPAGFVVLLIILLIFGLIFTYYSAFSSNNPPIAYHKRKYKSHLKTLGLSPPTRESVADNFMTVFFLLILLITSLVLANEFVRHSYETKCDDAGIVVNHSNSTSRSRRSVGLTGDGAGKYDICSQVWLGELNIVDLALLADASYKDESNSQSDGTGCTNKVDEFLQKYFSDWDWIIAGKPAGNELIGFYELYSAKRNLTVISIRGTRFSHLTDLMQDADLYTETATLQLFSLFVPITILLPLDTVAEIVYYSSFVERMFHDTASYYYETLTKYVKSKLNFYSGRVLFTGHSLGGSIAKIAGATLGIRAITFNSPGLLFSRRKFGLDRKQIDLTAVNVAMRHDIVSEIDRPGGAVHHIGCPVSSLITCHRIITVACEFQNKCNFPGRSLDCSGLS
eukprot:m.144543 g.144543  ORF g.144543 m.144543 type:complete len:736 (+) comp38402_c0_seq1:35-2242(+)